MATRWSHYQYLWLFRIPWTIFLAHRCHWCHNNWYALCSLSLPRRPSVRLLSLPISSAHYPNDLFSLSSFSPSPSPDSTSTPASQGGGARIIMDLPRLVSWLASLLPSLRIPPLPPSPVACVPTTEPRLRRWWPSTGKRPSSIPCL